ncbi:MAG: hypothetical protein D6693_11340 [Planctomycetota bacterium]|nr:MAG: hypothetical protein D6693_11340 [Planctomycetota bacterium]
MIPAAVAAAVACCALMGATQDRSPSSPAEQAASPATSVRVAGMLVPKRVRLITRYKRTALV